MVNYRIRGVIDYFYLPTNNPQLYYKEYICYIVGRTERDIYYVEKWNLIIIENQERRSI